MTREASSPDGRKDLSPRELEVLELIVDGLTDAEIAARVHLSLRTVQAHAASARRKLGARSRTEAAVFALRSGVVPLHPSGD